jgi:uncharacterized protein YgiB involved in biofilm formation
VGLASRFLPPTEWMGNRADRGTAETERDELLQKKAESSSNARWAPLVRGFMLWRRTSKARAAASYAHPAMENN